MKKNRKIYTRSISILGFFIFPLIAFFISLYLVFIIAFFIFPTQTPREALKNGELKITGKVVEITDDYVIFEKLSCNVYDCHVLIPEEFRVIKKPFDSLLSKDEGNGKFNVATVTIDKQVENKEYFESIVRPGLKYSLLFTHSEIDFTKNYFGEELIFGLKIYTIPVLAGGLVALLWIRAGKGKFK